MPRKSLLTAFGLVASIALLSVAFTARTEATAGPPSTGLGVEVAVTPLSDTPGGYECRALVRDLASEEVIAAPRVTFLRGEPAVIESSQESPQRRMTLTVEVAPDRPTLTYELTVEEAGRTTGRYSATVSLS